MTETLSFPGLGFDLELNRVAFSIGDVAFYWYGIIIAAGFALALFYAMKKVKVFGLDADRVVDVVIVGAIGAFICARLYYVIFSWSDYKDDLWSIFDTRSGGMAIYGGVIGAFLFGGIMCKIRKVKVLPMFDLTVGGLFIGQAIGRWGNFVNIEAFGSNTNMPWGMTSESITSYLRAQQDSLAKIGMTVDPSLPVHPTFLYESIWCAIGFFVLQAIIKRRRFDGECTLFYCVWYGAGRFVIEGMRTDSLMLGALRVSQLVAIIGCIAALATWIIVRSKIRRMGDPEYLQLYVNTDEGKAVLDGTYYKELKEKKKKRKLRKKLRKDMALKNAVEGNDETEDEEKSDEDDEAVEPSESEEETKSETVEDLLDSMSIEDDTDVNESDDDDYAESDEADDEDDAKKEKEE